jgi:hypothetical protein
MKEFCTAMKVPIIVLCLLAAHLRGVAHIATS